MDEVLLVVFLEGLPEFDAVTLAVKNMDELADALIVLDVIDNGHAFLSQLLHKALDVIHAIVDHDLLPWVAKVVGSFREGAPHGAAHEVAVALFIPLEGVAVGVLRNSQVLLVPLLHRLRVFALEEDASDSCYSFHWFFILVHNLCGDGDGHQCHHDCRHNQAVTRCISLSCRHQLSYFIIHRILQSVIMQR